MHGRWKHVVSKDSRHRIDSLIDEAILHSTDTPRYALLLCRMAAEGILMDAHLEMISEGEPKSIITLGDLNNAKLGFKFDPMVKTGLTYIQNVTNEYAHYQLELSDPDTKRVEKVIDELKEILKVLESKILNSPKPKKTRGVQQTTIDTDTDWKRTLELELSEFMYSAMALPLGQFTSLEKFLEMMTRRGTSCVCGKKRPKKKKRQPAFDELHSSCLEPVTNAYLAERERINNSGGMEIFVKDCIRGILGGCYNKHGGEHYTFENNALFPFSNRVIAWPVSSITPFEPFQFARFWMFLFDRVHPEIFLNRDWKFMQIS